jgi:hypothetical protein
MIVLQYQGKMYSIEQEPFETIEDTYKRGWYIVKNYDSNAYSKSLLMLNESKGLTYI